MSITRRNFVESALALASTSLATGGVSRAAEPAVAAPARPGDRLRVAVVGVNGRGASHLAGWTAMPDAEVVAICDCDPNVVPKRMEEFFKVADRRPEYVQDFRRLLDRKIVAGLPLGAHYPELADCGLLCVTETCSREEMDRLVREVTA